MQQVHGNQSNRHEHRGQYISYPVLQLLKSIQQEKEYVDIKFCKLSITFSYVDFLNVYLKHRFKLHLVM